MAEITRQRTGELLRKLFEILKEYPEGLKASDALARLASSVQLTTYEAGSYESGNRFEKIIRFATIDCVKAGWLVKQKGIWTLTTEGIAAYSQLKDPDAFYREATRLYNEWRRKSSKSDEARISVEEEDEGEATSITYEKAEELAWDEVEKYLKSMNPFDFQVLVADLLRGMGYFVSWISPPGKDLGVDIIAHPDPLGTQSPRLKVQVKRYTEGKVDRPTVQSFISTINDHDAGLFVCTSGFTKDAEDYARNQERRKIMLIDADGFFELWVQFYPKLDEGARQRLPITPIYFLTPNK